MAKLLYNGAVYESNDNKTSNQELILVRGASGSGKSTYAKKLSKSLGYKVYETDDFFIKNGEYKFDGSKIVEAHKWNQNRTINSLVNGESIIVANTFTRRFEIDPYIKMANDLNIPYTIYRSNARYKNVHNVPDSIVQNMIDRMEDIDGEILINK